MLQAAPMKLVRSFLCVVAAALAVPVTGCAGGAADAVEESESSALSALARTAVGEYRWAEGTAFLDLTSLSLRDAPGSWGTYEAMADVSLTGSLIVCVRAPCTSAEEGKWRILGSRGAYKLHLKPTGGTTRIYSVERQSDGSIKLSRGGQSGFLVPYEDPCNLTDCAPGNRCEVQNGQAVCLSDGTALPPCVRTGCSGQICSDQNRTTTCLWRPEYACYQQAICERGTDGQCGFRQTAALQACLSGQ